MEGSGFVRRHPSVIKTERRYELTSNISVRSIMMLGMAFFYAESSGAELHLSTSSMSAPADCKVNGLNFVGIGFHGLEISRRLLSSRCLATKSSGEDRPAQIAEVRAAARNALRSLLTKAMDTAVTNSANSASTQPSPSLNDTALLPPQLIRVGFIGTGTITTAVVSGLCGAEDARDLQITISPRSADKAAALRAAYPDQVTK